MKRPIKFNIRELAGSMGDFGTLFPLAVGYIAINGMNPTSLLIMIGIANIATGLIYRLPMPIEPMKVIAITAIAQQWEPSLIHAAGVSTGIVWLILAFSGIMDKISKIVPNTVIKGIQTGLGLMLSIQALRMMSDNWLLGILALLIIIFLKDNKYLPASIILIAGGMGLMYFQGNLSEVSYKGINLPNFQIVYLKDMWKSMVLAGFAQIPLTATNAVIATAALIKEYWPDSDVSEKQLSANMGVMNLVLPLFGGMPLCHGSGGLAGQYTFGARTGGTNIIEGTIEILLGLLLGSSIAIIFGSFPLGIIGSMMLFVGYRLILRGYESYLKDNSLKNVLPIIMTVLGTLILNMAVGFVLGMVSYYIIDYIKNE
ncbi:MAG: putative sulfate/molybdate transporter [Bacillota bacterium]|nr:putative sulfate/molybdate transporter [Bacillota bacterium]